MINLTLTTNGWQISLDGTQFEATEEQLLRLRDVIGRKFTRTEKVRRHCQRCWRSRNITTTRNIYGENFVMVPTGMNRSIPVEVEAFIRALPAKEQDAARKLLSNTGHDSVSLSES